MSRLRNLIKGVLSTPPKQENNDCCNFKKRINKGTTLNENINKRVIMTENMQYHVQNQLPLTENTFRYGSKAFLDLWSEARYLYVRDAINVNELDQEILTETHLGEYGIFEGKKVPLDLPMEELLSEGMSKSAIKDAIKVIDKQIDTETGGDGEPLTDETLQALEQERERLENMLGSLNEATKKKNTKKLNKPMRDSSGGKAYKVYVKDPKTGNIKTVRFGSGGLKAKIGNKQASQAYAKRHDCKNKKDRTKASYWSCNLPRYHKQLGLATPASTFW